MLRTILFLNIWGVKGEHKMKTLIHNVTNTWYTNTNNIISEYLRCKGRRQNENANPESHPISQGPGTSITDRHIDRKKDIYSYFGCRVNNTYIHVQKHICCL